MSFVEFIIFFVSILILVLAGFILYGRLRTKGQMQRALNMALLLIQLPREKDQQGDVPTSRQKNDKELIGISEQLLASFATLKAKGWNRLLYGSPYIALEMAVHHVGEQTHFYIAAPRKSLELIEKQIHSLYPKAEVQEVHDYNIFNPDGAHAGGFISYSQNDVLPIRTYRDLEADPLGVVLTSMSKLDAEGEGIALQVLIRPKQDLKRKNLATRVAREMQLGYQFKEALQRAKHPPKNKQEDEEKKNSPSLLNPNRTELPKVVTPADEEVIKSIGLKANSQAFDTNIRIVTSGPNQMFADQMFDELAGAFTQFSSPDMNNLLVNKLKKRLLNKLMYNFSFRLFDRQQTIFMSTAEVSSIYHLPISSTASPRVKFLSSSSSEPPSDLPKTGLHIGNSKYRGQEIPVHMTDGDRRRHVYIIGQTGTGKSSMMKHMIEQDLTAGKGLCIIEPHGDFAEHALSVVPASRSNDVIYFNPADLDRPLGLNILEFDPNHPEQKTLLINELLAIIDKLYNLKETGGPLFEKYFKNSCLLIMNNYQYDPTNESKIPVLADISRVLVDDDFRGRLLDNEKDPLVRQFWELEAQKAGGESSLANMAPYISSKIDTFVSNEFLRPIINQRKSTIDFRDAIDSGKILVVSLSKGRIGETNAQLLGMMVVTKLLAASLSRVDLPEDERKDFYLYLDEFQNITTESIATILSEARKYRLNLTMAHQFIKQLKEPIRDAVFGNAGSVIAFRVGPDDAEFMKNFFAPEFDAQSLSNIDNFNAHVKLLINGKTSTPFNIQSVKEADGSPELFEHIKATSRETYGRDKEEVEEEIRQGIEDEDF